MRGEGRFRCSASISVILMSHVNCVGIDTDAERFSPFVIVLTFTTIIRGLQWYHHLLSSTRTLKIIFLPFVFMFLLIKPMTTG